MLFYTFAKTLSKASTSILDNAPEKSTLVLLEDATYTLSSLISTWPNLNVVALKEHCEARGLVCHSEHRQITESDWCEIGAHSAPWVLLK